MIKLPEPEKLQGINLNKAIYERYSCRNFSNKKLNLKQVSNLLWAGGGKSKHRRTIPSAGATYPLEIYLIAGRNCLDELKDAVYLYDWKNNLLSVHLEGDLRKDLAFACLGQEFISEAPISILISADYRRTTSYYGKRGERYVHMEVGHACQNIHLEAVSLGLGTVVVGAFHDESIKILLKIKEEPLIVMPVGYPKSSE